MTVCVGRPIVSLMHDMSCALVFVLCSLHFRLGTCSLSLVPVPLSSSPDTHSRLLFVIPRVRSRLVLSSAMTVTYLSSLSSSCTSIYGPSLFHRSLKPHIISVSRARA